MRSPPIAICEAVRGAQSYPIIHLFDAMLYEWKAVAAEWYLSWALSVASASCVDSR